MRRLFVTPWLLAIAITCNVSVNLGHAENAEHNDRLVCDAASANEGCDAAEIDDEPGYGCLNSLLLGDDFSDATGISISGWIAQGFSWNPDSPADRFNGYLCNNDRANEYQLNQIYLSLDRQADLGTDSLSISFFSDLVYGADAFLFQSLGYDDKTISDKDSRFNKLAFPQSYADVYLPVGPGWNLRLGKWFTTAGYETGLAQSDIFYSHTLGYNLTPYTHVGGLLQTSLGDNLSVSAGIHRGSDVVRDNNNNLGFAGSIEWVSTDESTILYFGIVAGPEQDEDADWQDLDGASGADTPGENIDRVVYSLSIDRAISDSLAFAINHDFFYQEGSARYGLEQAEAYGITGYLFYTPADLPTINLRAEVLRDDDGWISSGFRSLNNPSAGVYTNLTIGLNWQLYENTMVRPEIRWDWQNQDDPSELPAFDDGTDTNQFLFAFDVVTTF